MRRRPTAVLSVVLAALLVAALAAVPASAGHGASTDLGVAGLDGWSQGDQVDLLLAVRTAGGIELRHTRSGDGGATWSPETLVPTDPPVSAASRGNAPQIAARGDLVLVVWTAPGSSPWGAGPLATALSSDGGATWQAGPNPADHGGTGGHGFVDLAVDAAGRFQAVWLDGREGAGQGLRAASTADGRTWSANETVDTATCECCWNRLLAGVDGSLHVLFRDRGPRDMSVATRAAGADGWSLRGAAGAFGWDIEACPHSGGGLAEVASGQAAPRLFASVWTGADGKVGSYVVEPGGADPAPLPLPDPTAKHSDLASVGGRVLVAWEGRDGSHHRIRAAQVAAGARRFGPVMELSAARISAQQPLVLPLADRFLVLWTERTGDRVSWAYQRVAIQPRSPAALPSAAGR